MNEKDSAPQEAGKAEIASGETVDYKPSIQCTCGAEWECGQFGWEMVATPHASKEAGKVEAVADEAVPGTFDPEERIQQWKAGLPAAAPCLKCGSPDECKKRGCAAEAVEKEDAFVIQRMGSLLAQIAVIVRGPEPARRRWGYTDLPERIAELVAFRQAVLDPENQPSQFGTTLYLRPSQQALGEDAKDALRYRWISKFYVPAGDEGEWDDMDTAVLIGGQVLDAAIDKRLEAILAASSGGTK